MSLPHSATPRPFVQSKGLRLKPLAVPGLGGAIDIGVQGLAIGRAVENDVVLSGDRFPTVSQFHLRLKRAERGLSIQDLGSRNGTLVNGERVEQCTLAAGDVLQLGASGPRFAVVTTSSLTETMFVDPSELPAALAARAAGEPPGRRSGRRSGRSAGHASAGQALSVDHVEALVRRRSRRQFVTTLALVALSLTAFFVWNQKLSERGAENDARLEEALVLARAQRDEELARIHALTAKMQREEDERAGEFDLVNARYGARLQALEVEKARILEERATLQARFDRLEADDTASTDELLRMRDEIETAREELTRTQASFQLLDPVNLEQARLEEVRRVRATNVLLEVTLRLRHRDSGQDLYIAEHQGQRIPNFEELGQPFELESTGSGFCVAADGWILTNAHVVTPGDSPMLRAAEELDVDPVLVVQAVFSGTDVRRPCEIVRVADTSGQDLALVKIEPFDGMPYLSNLDLSPPIPRPGSDVYLFGFPLGNFALQQGETVIASTFRGILSRVVGGRMQVDAGVHPGNSGGPVTDARGRVVGIVFSVQAMPDQSAAYSIGYAIPIAEASAVWPPPAIWPEPLADPEQPVALDMAMMGIPAPIR